jgi:hypothetical protein
MWWVDQTLLEQPRYTPALWMKVVLCELMGRHNAACEALTPVLKAWPGFTIEAFTTYAKLNYTAGLRAIYAETVRKVAFHRCNRHRSRDWSASGPPPLLKRARHKLAHGEFRQLPLVPASVSCLIAQRVLSSGGGNAQFAP